MSKLRFEISMSLDGFVAGRDQSEENGLGVGGESLHDWVIPLAAWREPHGLEGGEVNASSAVYEEALANVGATIMGRMFGPQRGPWGDDPWRGWWGEDPPFHRPVFVLTHHARKPLEMQGGTTFSSPTASSPHSSRPGAPRAARTLRWRGAPTLPMHGECAAKMLQYSMSQPRVSRERWSHPLAGGRCGAVCSRHSRGDHGCSGAVK